MALMVLQDGTTQYMRDTQTAINMFKIFASIGIIPVFSRDLRGSKEPWKHQSLQVLDPYRPVERDCRQWRKQLLAVVDDNACCKDGPKNRMFPEIHGNILFFWEYYSANGNVKLNAIQSQQDILSVIGAWRSMRQEDAKAHLIRRVHLADLRRRVS